MKRTIQINLFGTVYTIDEDAHQLLEQYFSNMRSYFSHQAGGEEIADDIEHRVAELFWEIREQGNGWNAISIEQVRDIIQKVGNPEQMESEATEGGLPQGGDQPKDNDTHSATDSESHPRNDGKPHADGPQRRQATTDSGSDGSGQSWLGQRRFFRDPSDKRIGGVISGICHYLGLKDPLLWRLVYAILCFLALFSEWPFFLHAIEHIIRWSMVFYLLIWMIAPEATSVEDRLRMKGKPVNPDSINDELLHSHGVYQASHSNPTDQNQARGCLSGVTDIMAVAVKVLLVIICVGIGIAFIFPITALIALICNAPMFGHLFGVPAEILQNTGDDKMMLSLLVIALITLVALPIYALCRWLFKTDKPLSAGMSAALIVLWIIALTYTAFSAARVFGTATDNLFGHILGGNWHYTVSINDDTNAITRTDIVNEFDKIEIEGVGQITYRQGSEYKVESHGIDNILAQTKVYAENGILHICNVEKDGAQHDMQNIRITITSPTLSEAKMQGVGSLTLADTVRCTGPIMLQLEGVGQLKADYLQAPTIIAENRGVGSTILNVKCDSLKARIEGVGSMKLEGQTGYYYRNNDELLGHINDSGLEVRD